MRLKVGDQAPAVDLIDQSGKQRRSSELRGKALVLFFYPKDETPGCTAEVCAFRDAYEDFKRLGAEVWGVSEDNRERRRRAEEFAKKNNVSAQNVAGAWPLNQNFPSFIAIKYILHIIN